LAQFENADLSTALRSAKDGAPSIISTRVARILCGIVVFLLIPLASMGAQTKPKPASGYRISGTVINAASGEPVRRATVAVLSNADRQTVESVETDSDGRFAFDGLPAGKYPLTASKRGFLTAFYIEHEGGFNTAIVTGADQQSTGLVFQLTPGTSLYGVVTVDGGLPFARPPRSVRLRRQLFPARCGPRPIHGCGDSRRLEAGLAAP
jgi:5-hydroxyisourate hydrolase-like protein (transthyretin family)